MGVVELLQRGKPLGYDKKRYFTGFAEKYPILDHGEGLYGLCLCLDDLCVMGQVEYSGS